MHLDASRSRDPDGTVTGYTWYVDAGGTEQVYTGRSVTARLPIQGAATVSLQVTDDRGDSEFATRRFAGIDVMPGFSPPAPILRAKGLTPLVVLSHEGFDATRVPVGRLRVGPGGAPGKLLGTLYKDVNRDGRKDLFTLVDNPSMRIARGATSLCLVGVLPGGGEFEGCDAIRTIG